MTEPSAQFAQLAHQAPAVTCWLQRFATDPATALGLALSGQLSLGPYDRARPADALAQILSEADRPTADAGLQQWLASLLGQATPAALSGKRFAEALVEGLRLISLLHLTETRAWCARQHGPLRAWLRSFTLGPSRDPEAALLIALAQDGQCDRSLLPLWQNIIRRGRPLAHVRIALNGLRWLPADDQGKVEHGIPRPLLQGLLDFGEALARRGEQKGTDWLLEIDFLAAIYPMSADTWGRKFRDVVHNRHPSAPVSKWLDQRYPLALKPLEKGARKGPLEPPYFKTIQPLLQKLESHFQQVRPQLEQFFKDSRHYCRESGDSHYLVRSFCFAGDYLLKVDPTWARELAHEATLWAPSNHRTWSLLARALEAEGDWRRAEAVFWHARRRFPENVQSHNQLAHALLLHGSADLGEAAYRQAIALFPDDPVCRSDLAHTLIILDRQEEALAEYQQAKDIFPRNVVVTNAIADLLIAMNRLDEAAEALGWAEYLTPSDDHHNQSKLSQIHRRLQRAQSGHAQPLRQLQARPNGNDGDLAALAGLTGSDIGHAARLGQASLHRRQGVDGRQRAWRLLDEIPASPEQLVEVGLCTAAERGWAEAATFFAGVIPRYAGDGVLRVHHQRSRARAAQNVDWSAEQRLYPELLAVILTEGGNPPHPKRTLQDEEDEEAQEYLQDAWFAQCVQRGDSALRDWVEEEYLAARHLL